MIRPAIIETYEFYNAIKNISLLSNKITIQWNGEHLNISSTNDPNKVITFNLKDNDIHDFDHNLLMIQHAIKPQPISSNNDENFTLDVQEIDPNNIFIVGSIYGPIEEFDLKSLSGPKYFDINLNNLHKSLYKLSNLPGWSKIYILEDCFHFRSNIGHIGILDLFIKNLNI